MARGSFIVLEGIDGSGTTSQADLLADTLRDGGRDVLVTREPSTGPVGRFLRQALAHQLRDGDGQPASLHWAAMAQLFAADRIDHVEREIAPALADGRVVISDRYDLSSLVYQSATSPEREAALPWLKTLNARARRPDLTIVLDVDPQVAAQRRATRGGEAELYERDELQARLARLYARGPELLPDDRFAVLDGNGSLQDVRAAIWAAVRIVVA